MKFISRLLFVLSVIALVLFTFNLAVEYNKALLYFFMTGFAASFITSFFESENNSIRLWVRWLSGLVVIGILLYVVVFGSLWGLANRP